MGVARLDQISRPIWQHCSRLLCVFGLLRRSNLKVFQRYPIDQASYRQSTVYTTWPLKVGLHTGYMTSSNGGGDKLACLEEMEMNPCNFTHVCGR